MATATEAPVGTKTESEVEADQALMRRHLRRRIRCEWDNAEPNHADIALGEYIWSVDLKWSEKKGKHIVALSLYIPEQNIDRRFECSSFNPYTAIKETILIHSSIALAINLDLMSDDF